MGGLTKAASKIQRLASPLTKSFDKKLEDSVYGEGWNQKPEAPALPKVVEMPDEESIAKARKRSDSRRRQGAGRSGTILSDGLGG